jgi:hypothetical protein
MPAVPTPTPRVPATQLRPYKSVLVLEYDGADRSRAWATLRYRLEQLVRKTRGDERVQIVADGISEGVIRDLRFDDGDDEELGLDAILSAHTGSPSWATKEFEFQNIEHRLCIWTSRVNLVAISCGGSLEEKIQRWLDSNPAPPFRRVSPGVLNATLLSGEARGLWLRATHGRRRTKADAKTLSGQDLRQALNPIEDSTFAMGSARADFVPDPKYSALTGIVGVTPRRSKVWLQASQSLYDYVSSIRDLLRALAQCIAEGLSEEAPFPWLAAEVRDLSQVSDAFELVWSSVDDLPDDVVSPEIEAAAALLNRSGVVVRGTPGSPHFELDVSVDGKTSGTLGCTVTRQARSTRLDFGFRGIQTDETHSRMVLDALQQTELLSVHYESGHAITHGTIWTSQLQDAEFPGWSWHDFDGYNVCREKPDTQKPQEIHDRIGTQGENSLFSWVLANFGELGYLTCDDGANEVADFVLLDDETEELTLIHVKSAGSPHPNRRISASKLEVVTSQATKNVRYLEQGHLIEALQAPPVAKPAVWFKGMRAPDRSDLLETLKLRSSRSPARVLIVQPHLTERARTSAATQPDSIDARRLRLAEMLLNTARTSVVASGSDLRAIGAK